MGSNLAFGGSFQREKIDESFDIRLFFFFCFYHCQEVYQPKELVTAPSWQRRKHLIRVLGMRSCWFSSQNCLTCHLWKALFTLPDGTFTRTLYLLFGGLLWAKKDSAVQSTSSFKWMIKWWRIAGPKLFHGLGQPGQPRASCQKSKTGQRWIDMKCQVEQ